MPHITLQIASNGPLLDIAVGVSLVRRDALQRASQPVPSYVQIRGLVDTGASCTCIDPTVLQGLGLTPTGTAPMHTPSTGNQPHMANEYDVSLVLISPDLNLTLNNVPVVEDHLSLQGIQALIGRDVLEICLLVYDGQEGTFTIAF